MFTLRTRPKLSRIAALMLVAVSCTTAEETNPSFLAGLSFQNTANSQSYAFLRWRGTAPAPATIYVKTGNADSVAAFTRTGRLAATFELRADDGATVIGRVTVDTTTPADLPVPPAPLHITDLGPTGHLNVKLRWPVNDELLRATPKTFGYDVIRIDRALAESLGTHTAPPTADGIAALMLAHPAQVRRVNEGAVLSIPGNDPLVPFLVDDNGARFGEGAPFSDGDSFYYHITVRDLLGRPGPLSPGTLVTVCERMPPGSPRRVEVTTKRLQVGQTTSGQNRLLVKWRPSPSSAGKPPRGYRVSRWSQFADIAGGTALATSAEISHNPGLEIYQWIDNLPGRPATLADEARRARSPPPAHASRWLCLMPV